MLISVINVEITALTAQKMLEPHMNDENYFVKPEEQSLQLFDNRCGVLSLCGNISNLELWKYYADEFQGFAIGLDPKIVFPLFGEGGKVDYPEVLPIILPSPFMESNVQLSLQVFSKLEKWEWEDEYRTFIFNRFLDTEDRLKSLPPEAYKEIWIGHKIPKKTEDDLRANLTVSLDTEELRNRKILRFDTNLPKR